MKRILLLLLLFSSFGLSADSSKTLTINNLDISVTGEYKVEVYKGMKHMFSFDCRLYTMCEIFTTTKQDPEYKMIDGMVYESDDLKPLAIENIKEVIDIGFYGGNIIRFFVITSPTATTGSRTMYKINTETGGVTEYREEKFATTGWLIIPEDTVCYETVPLFGGEITAFEAKLAALLAEEAVEKEIAEFEANLAKELADQAAQEMMAEIEAECEAKAKLPKLQPTVCERTGGYEAYVLGIKN